VIYAEIQLKNGETFMAKRSFVGGKVQKILPPLIDSEIMESMEARPIEKKEVKRNVLSRVVDY